MSPLEEPSVSRHEDLVAVPSPRPRTSNPFAQSSNITVSVPESVEVRLVDASALSDYEVWSLVTSILASAVVGFLVAFFQADAATKHLYGAVVVVFAILLALSGVMAFTKRRTLTRNTKRLRFSVGDQLPPDDGSGTTG